MSTIKYICNPETRYYRAIVTTYGYRNKAMITLNEISKQLTEQGIKFRTLYPKRVLPTETDPYHNMLWQVAFVFYCEKSIVSFKLIIE